VIPSDSKEFNTPTAQSAKVKIAVGDIVGVLALIVAAPAGVVAMIMLVRYIRQRRETRQGKLSPSVG
jgi:ABC-type phosphate transport system permease subunit